MTDEPGVRFGLANGALVLALLAASALPLDRSETAGVALITAGVVSAALPSRFALAMGFVSWAWFTGFFENRYGVLTLAPSDLLSLGGFVATTVLLARLVQVPLAAARGRSRE
jgi:hypothetical protein